MLLEKIRIIIFLISIIFINSCEDKPTPPAVTTTTLITDISYTTATSGGEAISDGGASIVSKGICWNTSADPDISNSRTIEPGGLGAFTSKLTQLSPNTMYYVRAYATNSAGTGYGNQVSFTTSQVEAPLLTTTEITGILQTSAVSGGNITDEKGGSVTVRGVCWATASNPTTSDSKTSDGSGTGSFESKITDLQPGTTYYVRAYATNSQGTGYGNELSFTTLPVGAVFPYIRALSMEGNWGGNIDAIKDIPAEYIQRLKDNNVEWVGIKCSIFCEPISDPVVRVIYRPAGEIDYAKMYSFDDQDLINAIRLFKQNGMKIYLSILFMLTNSDQSATSNTAQFCVDSHLFGDPQIPEAFNSSFFGSAGINPSMWWWSPDHPDHTKNVEIFWRTYTEVAVKYAKIANDNNVEMYAIGEETDRLFRTQPSTRFPTSFKPQLVQLVQSVRDVYSGLLTYGQQVFVYLDHPEWWGLDSKASSSLFRDLNLDVIGLSAYFTLVNDPDLNHVVEVPALESAWSNVFNAYLKPLHNKYPDIPLFFTDFGSVNSVVSAFSPTSNSGDLFIFEDHNSNGIDDGNEQQRNIFQAFFNVNRNNNYLVRGTNFFGNSIDYNPATREWFTTHRSMQLYGKPVEEVIRSEYEKIKVLEMN